MTLTQIELVPLEATQHKSQETSEASAAPHQADCHVCVSCEEKTKNVDEAANVRRKTSRH